MSKLLNTRETLNLKIEELNSREVEIIKQTLSERIDVLFTFYEKERMLLNAPNLATIKQNFIHKLIFEIDQIIIHKKNNKS